MKKIGNMRTLFLVMAISLLLTANAFAGQSPAEVKGENPMTPKAAPVRNKDAGQLEEGQQAYNRSDYAAALNLWRPLAEQGNAEAEYWVGEAYYWGNGVAKDYAQALLWLNKSADKGNAFASRRLGVMYEKGYGVDKDEGKARKLYTEAFPVIRKAAGSGNAWSQFWLGVMYEYGNGTDKDEAAAVEWYRKLADQGYALAQNNLGAAYANGHGVTRDEAEAVKWYRKAAEQGYALAQDNLGFAYANGHGVAKDEAEAMKWYRKAAEQGYNYAQKHLGDFYALGKGVKQDYAEAIRLYLKSNLEMEYTDFIRYLKNVSALLYVLKDKDWAVRGKAARIIGSLGGRSAVPALSEALKDKNEVVRYCAAMALGEIRDRSAVPALVEALKDENKHIGEAAAEALGEIGDKKTVPMLIDAVRGKESLISMNAVWYLGRIGDRSAVPALIETLKDKNSDVREYAAKALGEIGDKRAVLPLLQILKDKYAGVRITAAAALGEIGDRSAVPALIEALNDKEALNYTKVYFPVKRSISEALGQIGDESAVQVLLNKALTDDDPAVREYARMSLMEIKGKSAVPMLIEALKNNKGEVRSYAAEALGEIGDESAVAALVETLQDKEPEIRKQAVDALGEIMSKSAVPALIEALKDKNNNVRETAARALGKIRDKSAVPMLIAALKDKAENVRYSVAGALGEIGDKSAVPVLIEALKDKAEDVRYSAAGALGRIGDKSAVPVLIEALQDEKQHVRYWAAWSLGEIRDKSAVPVLITALKDKDKDVRYSVVEALGKTGDKSAIQALKEALQDENYMMRYYAANSLMLIGDNSSIPELIDQLKGSHYDYDSVFQYLEENKPINRVSVEVLMKVFREKFNTKLFNFLRKNPSDIETSSLEMLTTAEDTMVSAAGYYLKAYKAQEEGRYREALEDAGKALQGIDPKNETALALLALWVETKADLKLGQPQEALKSIKQAEQLLDYLSKREREAYKELFRENTLFWQGEVYSALGENRVAQKAYEEALESLEQLKKRDRSSEPVDRLGGMVRTGLGLLQIQMGKENLQKAVEGSANYRAGNSNELESEEKRYLGLAKQNMAEGNYEEAQRLIEELNLRRMNYINRRMKLTLADPEKQRHAEEYKKKQQEIDAVTGKIEEEKRKASGKDSKGGREGAAQDEGLKKLEQEKNARTRELQQYINGLKKTAPDMAALLGAKPIELKNAQERLLPDTAILQYLLLPAGYQKESKDKLIVFVIKTTGIEIYEQELKEGLGELKGRIETHKKLIKEIQKAINEQRGIPTRITTWMNENYKALYGILIRPIEEKGYLKGITRLGIAPNGFLHYLPFGALLREENGKSENLIDRYSLFYINSTSMYYIATDKSGRNEYSRARLIAFSNPDNSLPHADREVEDIGKLFGSNKQIYLHKAANKEAVNKGNMDNSVLHFSTHGRLAANSADSYLVLADKERLTVQDIWGLALKGNILTTLSACETGIGELLSGDEIVSLENAFFYAGSPSVLATLWEVESASTTEIMKEFYKNLSEGKNKAEALTLAQKSLRDKTDYKEPYYWAGFTLRGVL